MKMIGNVLVIDGPVWQDGCDHPKDSYIASFETLGDKYDLYVWETETFGSSVCIRHGNECSEYAGITSILELATGAQCGMESYRDALALIRHFGRVVWQRK